MRIFTIQLFSPYYFSQLPLKCYQQYYWFYPYFVIYLCFLTWEYYIFYFFTFTDDLLVRCSFRKIINCFFFLWVVTSRQTPGQSKQHKYQDYLCWSLFINKVAGCRLWHLLVLFLYEFWTNSTHNHIVIMLTWNK